ncbi:MAG: RdgB/HAM1 family non-canonical purine NTP pyrophosphatase [Spirochaetota bacterium]|nr:RdgB/HAM1 family non-canonical purine NTP pyrophosphatase [Spirochaetota bacterium]
MEIVLASGNRGKLGEIEKILEGFPVTLRSMAEFDGIPDEIVEDGETFLDNAMIKAKAVYEVVKRPTLSEDSGLVVDALDGEPGVRSARYGCDNDEKPDPDWINALILKKLDGVPQARRGAHYKAVVVLMIDEETILTAEGECMGEIALAPRGDNGFGFDPIFELPQYGKTAAEISPHEKNAVSHRGLALEKLKAKLLKYMDIEA